MLLAVDIGGTKTTAAAVALDVARGEATVLADRTAPTPASADPEAVLATAAQLLRDVREGHPEPRALGIATAGVVDPDTGAITHATDSLPGWAGTPVRDGLAEALGLPAAALNDVHAHGLGEARFGAAAGATSALLVAVGTGIGGAVLLDGSVVPGHHGVAGHVGHLPVPEAEGVPCSCGRTGHLEGFASGPGILRQVGAGDGRALAAAAASGDADAAAAYQRAGVATGRVLGGLANALDPEVIVLTGGVAEAVGPWWEAVREGFRHDALDAVRGTPLFRARAGVRAALLGAAVHAHDHAPERSS
ncbi:ROK family protein [Brachybacterium sillae]|uniref:ROK family protein n=1 Tax=Brachybacterium sillae TaxID=2810536 RepID=UPI00217EB153|nr:ROK family protein [Brachybacterium sillae]